MSFARLHEETPQFNRDVAAPRWRQLPCHHHRIQTPWRECSSCADCAQLVWPKTCRARAAAATGGNSSQMTGHARPFGPTRLPVASFFTTLDIFRRPARWLTRDHLARRGHASSTSAEPERVVRNQRARPGLSHSPRYRPCTALSSSDCLRAGLARAGLAAQTTFGLGWRSAGAADCVRRR